MNEDEKKTERMKSMSVVFEIMYGKKKPEGVPVKTGFEFLDTVSGGWKAGELVILAGTGKKSVIK